MARKATIDVDKAMQMLREGQSTQAVADFFGVSRQAIDLHRRKLIQAGQLIDKRAPRVAAPLQTVTKEAEKEEPIKSGIKETEVAAPVSLDSLIELAIDAFGSLKKVPQLEAELAQCKQDYEKAARRIAELEQELSKRQEQETRWKLAMTGDALVSPKPEPPPVTSP